MTVKKYRLKREIPGLPAGAIFEHREYDHKHPDRGNLGHGCMILGWINGNCQAGWCGETFVFPGQLAADREWFEPLETTKEDLIREIEELRRKVEGL